MKQFNFILLAMLLLIIASCKKDNVSGNNDVKPVTITVSASYDTENAALALALNNVQVKITNLTTSQTYTVATTNEGIATFKDIAPGNYDVSAVQTISANDYNTAAGTNVSDAVVFNGSLSRQSFTQDGKFDVTLKTGRVGDLVIKQIYYAGSSATNGAIYRDQFIEIYNNSNETLYADSLYFGQTNSIATTATSIDLTKGFYLPSGQYDWTKSVGMSNSKANTDYIYMSTLFMIPGTGKQYPILPGKSIIVAATAQNHKSPFTGADGKAISVKDPSLTVDLSGADFEVYLGDQDGISPLASDLDNPAVPNVTVIDRGGNRDLILDTHGREAIVIFKSAVDPKTWTKYPTPDVTQVTASTKTSFQIPISVITDGVGLQYATPAKRVPKTIIDVIDAGETYVPNDSYSSQSVVRKTSKTISGRIVLKDTNNSSNDFGYLNMVDASKSASSFLN